MQTSCKTCKHSLVSSTQWWTKQEAQTSISRSSSRIQGKRRKRKKKRGDLFLLLFIPFILFAISLFCIFLFYTDFIAFTKGKRCLFLLVFFLFIILNFFSLLCRIWLRKRKEKEKKENEKTKEYCFTHLFCVWLALSYFARFVR